MIWIIKKKRTCKLVTISASQSDNILIRVFDELKRVLSVILSANYKLIMEMLFTEDLYTQIMNVTSSTSYMVQMYNQAAQKKVAGNKRKNAMAM